MEFIFAFIILFVTMLVFYSASKNSFRSKMLQDLDRNSTLAKAALERGDWKSHREYKKKSEEIYAMLRRCDYTDRNTHWRL